MKYFELNNGDKIPSIGIGTFTFKPDEAEEAVYEALLNGYRLIDTANGYMNEKAVGRAIRKSGIPRDEIFLTSKLMPAVYKKADENIDATLTRLDVDYIDLMLLHQPYGAVENAWKQLEKAVEQGKIKAIGISNFDEKQINKLLSYASIKPAILQTECHPYFAEKEARSKYTKDGIRIEAWYPLGHGDSRLINESIFSELANKYGKSKVQIILRWHIQIGNIAISGSKNPEHINSNIDIFDFVLTDQEMKEITKLDKNKRFFRMPNFLGAIIFPMVKLNYDSQK